MPQASQEVYLMPGLSSKGLSQGGPAIIEHRFQAQFPPCFSEWFFLGVEVLWSTSPSISWDLRWIRMSFWAIYVSNAIKYFSPSHVLPGLISFRKSYQFPAAERLQSIEIARKYPVLAAWALPAYCAVPASRSTVPFKSLGPRPVLHKPVILLSTQALVHT